MAPVCYYAETKPARGHDAASAPVRPVQRPDPVRHAADPARRRAALLGLGGAAPETFKGLGISISSAGPGLVIATLGIALIYLATRKVRGGVQVFAITERTPLERGADLVPWLLLGLLALDAVALLWWRLG